MVKRIVATPTKGSGFDHCFSRVLAIDGFSQQKNLAFPRRQIVSPKEVSALLKFLGEKVSNK